MHSALAMLMGTIAGAAKDSAQQRSKIDRSTAIFPSAKPGFDFLVEKKLTELVAENKRYVSYKITDLGKACITTGLEYGNAKLAWRDNDDDEKPDKLTAMQLFLRLWVRGWTFILRPRPTPKESVESPIAPYVPGEFQRYFRRI